MCSFYLRTISRTPVDKYIIYERNLTAQFLVLAQLLVFSAQKLVEIAQKLVDNAQKLVEIAQKLVDKSPQTASLLASSPP